MSSGSFDVVIRDTAGSPAFNLAAFAVQLGLDGSGVHFTDTNTSTAPTYLYTWNSFDDINGFTIDPTGRPYPKSDFVVSDLANGPIAFQTINPGDLFGLVHVLYSVDSNAQAWRQNLTIENIGVGTSLADEIGNGVPFATLDGTFTVTSVPEVSAGLMVLLVAGLAIVWRRWR